MQEDKSVVKSFRISEDMFEQANEIFKKEGFSLSEIVRLVCEASIREGRIPRALSTKEMESKLDNSTTREHYIDSILGMVGIIPEKQRGMDAKERLMVALFPEKQKSDALSNEDLREWAAMWGFPEETSIATLAELHDCGIFSDCPWYGAYDSNIQPFDRQTKTVDEHLQSAMIIMEYRDNIRDNLDQIKRQFETRAVKHLMEIDNEE